MLVHETNSPQPNPAAEPHPVTGPQAASGSHAAPINHHKLDRADFLLLAVMVVAAFILILNETLLGVALPSLIADFNIDARTAQWSSTGFMLTMAVVTPASGFIISRFSIRTVFCGAMTLFCLGALSAGLAPTFGFLIAGRILQAMGTGIIMPLLMTTMMRLVPPARIGRAMGLVGMVISAAPALGPTVSGLILGVASWHWLFLAVLPIGLAALLTGVRLAPASLPEGGADQKLDLLSMVLSTLGFGGLVMGLSTLGGASHGAGVTEESTGPAVNPWLLIAVSLVILAVFVWRQLRLQRGASPFMDLRVFTYYPFVLTVLMTSTAMGVLLGSSVLLPLYTVNVLGMNALTTGLMLLPGGVASALLSPVVGGFSDKFGARALVIPGAAVFSGAIWLMTLFGADTPVWFIVATYFVLSASIPFMSTPMMGLGLGSLPGRLYSYGSSAMTTVQQVASAASTAIFVALMGIGAQAFDGDTTSVSAQAAGVHLALLVAACLSLVAVVVALILPRRASLPASEQVVDH